MTIDSEEFLEHFGVKGMKWGVRKETSADLTLPSVQSKGVTIRSDGSMSISPGATLQRLTRSNGNSLPMKDLTYASLNDYDNAKYIKTIGGSGFFGGGRDQILGITATKRIEAPSLDKATRMHSELMLKNAKYRSKNTNMLGEPIGKKELKQIADDPGGKTARAWYEMTNVKLTFDKDFDEDAPYVQKVIRDEFKAKGFNAVRDENDVSGKISKAPIIIFSPEDSLKVTSSTMITNEIRRANKEKLKVYKQQGKDWLDKELYDDR